MIFVYVFCLYVMCQTFAHQEYEYTEPQSVRIEMMVRNNYMHTFTLLVNNSQVRALHAQQRHLFRSFLFCLFSMWTSLVPYDCCSLSSLLGLCRKCKRDRIKASKTKTRRRTHPRRRCVCVNKKMSWSVLCRVRCKNIMTEWSIYPCLFFRMETFQVHSKTCQMISYFQSKIGSRGSIL